MKVEFLGGPKDGEVDDYLTMPPREEWVRWIKGKGANAARLHHSTARAILEKLKLNALDPSIGCGVYRLVRRDGRLCYEWDGER